MLFANNFQFIIDDIKLHLDNPEKRSSWTNWRIWL